MAVPLNLIHKKRWPSIRVIGTTPGLTESYVYDAGNNLTSKADRKGQQIQYVYDALSRLSHKGYPDATGVDYVYDLAGKIKQVTDPPARTALPMTTWAG